MATRTIEIDFDVHKLIETNRTGFDDTPNAVLRRMLNLSGSGAGGPVAGANRPGSWVDGPVVLPEFTQLRMIYNNQRFLAMIRGGVWVDEEGGRHTTPSGAACSLARTKDGKKTHLNGKNYWEVNLPDSPEWVLYAELERRAKAGEV